MQDKGLVKFVPIILFAISTLTMSLLSILWRFGLSKGMRLIARLWLILFQVKAGVLDLYEMVRPSPSEWPSKRSMYCPFWLQRYVFEILTGS